MFTKTKIRSNKYPALRAEIKRSFVGVEEADKTEYAISTARHPPDVAPLNELQNSWINYLEGGVYSQCSAGLLPREDPRIIWGITVISFQDGINVS